MDGLTGCKQAREARVGRLRLYYSAGEFGDFMNYVCVFVAMFLLKSLHLIKDEFIKQK